MTAIGTNRATHGVVGIEDRPELERQDCSQFETFTDYMRMIERALLVKGGGFVGADDDGEVTGGIAQYLGSANTLKMLDRKRTPRARCAQEGMLLNNTVRVPRHAVTLRARTEIGDQGPNGLYGKN